MKQLQQITFTTLMALGLSACGGGSNTNQETSTQLVHNGTTYGTVTSPFTDKVWLDRNLGAARVCEQFDDVACFGDYYQWGRNFDGHQDSTSGITIVQATSISGRESDFIIKSEDWVSVDSTGNARSVNWSKTDGSSVCPVDFRVPTLEELQAELFGAVAIQNRDDAFSNFLKLPSSGIRKFSSGTLVKKGTRGEIWTSSRTSVRSHVIYFDSNNAINLSELRAQGYSIRCIKN
jgi:hypothetical protein